MIHIRRTWLEKEPQEIVERLFDYLVDDSQLDRDARIRLSNDSRWYIGELDGEVAGAFWMRRENLVTWEAHANVLPEFWGDKRGTKLCQSAIGTMIQDTGAAKVIATIPDSSPETQRMAEAIGFKREGVRKRSWQKNGKLYDQVYYGITRNK